MYKKITELRKAGKLQDAYNLAKQEFENDKNNIYIKNAYSWVLYDLIKNEKYFQKILSLLNEFLSLDIQKIGIKVSKDEIDIYEKIDFLISKFIELNSNSFFEFIDILKGDKIIINNFFGKKCFWFFYKILKKNLKELNYLKIKKILEFIEKIDNFIYYDTEKNQIISFYEIIGVQFSSILKNENDLQIYKNILFLYIKLKNERPSETHSWILIHTLNKLKNNENFKQNFDFIKFIELWGINNFSEIDFEEKEFEGKKMQSNFEKVFSIFGQNLKNMDDKNREIFYKIFLKGEKLGFKWSNYYFAKYFLEIGEFFKAEDYILKTIKKETKQAWAWHLLADLFKLKENEELYFSCLAKVLSIGGKDDFLGNYRKEFAEVLISKNFFKEANIEINLIIKNKKENNYKIGDDILKLTKYDWYDEILEGTNKNFYNKFKDESEDYLIKDIKENIVFVKNVNKEKNIISFIDENKKEGYFNLGLYKDKKINFGDLLFVKMEKISEKKYNLYKILKEKPNPEDFFKNNNLIYIDKINEVKNIFNFYFKDGKYGFGNFLNFNLKIGEIRKINLEKKDGDYYQIHHIFDNKINIDDFLITERIIITKIDFDKNILNFLNENKKGFFNFFEYKEIFKDFQRNDFLEVKILKIKDEKYKILKFCEKIENIENELEGEIIIKNNFGFLNNIFIPEKILRDFLELNEIKLLEDLDGKIIKILYKKTFDFKKNRFSEIGTKIIGILG